MSSIRESELRRRAAEALRKARRLPVGSAHNDLRQLAISLRWLESRGIDSGPAIVIAFGDASDAPSEHVS